ncbi:hypothetical protein AC792_02900 [Arthrobacter sp. RIT-PI-e]|uniref:phosphotransferase family protein n=1 Tax=Arthrobacter sp. RIT-PI-e TaxID=1681197 RepID=UPI0006760694|nr:phosphotransferase [Arthrobacter sp. RIT-PI-e]KNC20087.1 hypothetical protein AC792_02900 [Arthrobacter sp. RIT-PI-e]
MTPFDYSSTARRPAYATLPDEVRDAIVTTLGGPPDDVRPAGGGLTPGFAATVRRGGTSLFVKAAPDTGTFTYPAYRREADILAALPDGLPVPRLLTASTVPERGTGATWIVLCIEHIEGVMPGAPWRSSDARSVHASLVELNSGLADLPPHLVTGSSTDGLVDDDDVLGVFGRRARNELALPFLPDAPAECWLDLQQLVEQAASVLHGRDTLHNDLRPDNIVIERGSGRAYVCDWNFLTRGPAWSDWAGLLPYLHHDGLDADTLLVSSPLTAGVEGGTIDTWLAVLAAYLTVSGLSSEVPTSPRLRAHGRFSARIMVDWVSERRKWTP